MANAVCGKREHTSKASLTWCLSRACGPSGPQEGSAPWWDPLGSLRCVTPRDRSGGKKGSSQHLGS